MKKGKVDAARLRRVYDMSVDELEEMFIQQSGRCAICFKREDDSPQRLDLDHDHETGRVRALLCRQCNTALGLFKEDIQVMLQAIRYIKRYKN